MYMNMFRLLAVGICIIFVFSLVLIPFANADWIMFHANPSHSGAGTGNPHFSPVLLWKYAASYWVYSSPAVVNGVVYVGSWDDNVYALNATRGNKLWNYTTGNEVGSSPAVVNGVVYIGSYDGNVYALNAANGEKLWSYPTNYDVASSPAVVGNVVYIGAEDGNVYALNATGGNKLWNYKTGNEVWSSPAVVNGIIYIGSDDNNIYALGASSPSSNTLFIIIVLATAVVIGIAGILLIFRNRLKTKIKVRRTLSVSFCEKFGSLLGYYVNKIKNISLKKKMIKRHLCR